MDKRREDFEKWFADSGFVKFKETAWAAYNAALDSLVVDLPEEKSLNFHHEGTVVCNDCFNDCLLEIKESLAKAGIKYK
jgi:hypothetical protein